jgi:hypothetical protein
MNQVYLQPVILSAFGGTTTDVVVNDGYLTLGNATKYTPALYMPNASAKIQKSLVETPSVATVAYTFANSTAYAFTVVQYNRTLQSYQTYIVSYTSDAIATDAEIATGLKASFNAQVSANGGGTLNGNIAGAATPLTVYGNTGDMVLSVVASTNTTVNTAPTTTTTAVAPVVAIVSSTDATPIVVTTGASTWVVGQTVTIAGHLVNTTANGTWRIRTVVGNAITLEYMNGANSVGAGGGAGGATGTATRLGQAAVGTYAQVAAVSTNGTALAGSTYTTFTLNFYPKVSEILTNMARQSTQQVVYMDEVTANANFLSNLAALRNVCNGQDVGGTVANNELISIGS